MIVLDASVLIKVLTGEVGGDRALLRLSGEKERVAPDWIRLEVASALAKKVGLGEFSASAAKLAIESVSRILTEFHRALDLLDHGWEIAIKLEHAIYDCLYLALAETLDCMLLTADAKFVKALSGTQFARRVELLA